MANVKAFSESQNYLRITTTQPNLFVYVNSYFEDNIHTIPLRIVDNNIKTT